MGGAIRQKCSPLRVARRELLLYEFRFIDFKSAEKAVHLWWWFFHHGHFFSIHFVPSVRSDGPIINRALCGAYIVHTYHEVDGFGEGPRRRDELGHGSLLTAVGEDCAGGRILTRPVDGPIAVKDKRPISPPQCFVFIKNESGKTTKREEKKNENS